MKLPRLLLCLGLLPWLARADAPVNGSDDFASRPALALGETVAGDLAGATSEPGEPVLSTSEFGRTRWWSVAAPAKGRLLITVLPVSSLTPTLTVFRGDNFPTLTGAGSNTASGGCSLGPPPRYGVLADDVAAGEVVSLAADIPRSPFDLVQIDPVTGLVTHPYHGPTQFQFAVTFEPAPLNDDFASPGVLPAEVLSIEANLFAASREESEPMVATNSLGRTVWFTWTAPQHGRLAIAPELPPEHSQPAEHTAAAAWSDSLLLAREWSLLAPAYWLPVGYGGTGVLGSSGSGLIDTGPGGGGGGVIIINFDPCRVAPSPLTVPVVPQLAVFTGDTPATLARVTSGARLDFIAEAGTTYRFAMDATEGELGMARLQARFTAAPVNDAHDSALPLTGPSADAVGHTVAATREAFEGFTGSGTVWWKWTAESEGPVNLRAASADANVQLTVWRDDQPGGPKAMLSGTNAVSFYAGRGQRFSMSLATLERESDYTFSLRQLPARLRPTLIHPSADGSGLLIAETGWKRALLQRAENGNWVDAGAIEGLPAPTNGVTIGYYVPLGLPNLDPSAAGLFRVWLVDFEPPAPTLSFDGFSAISGALLPNLTLTGPPGGFYRFETSTDLMQWSATGISPTDGGPRHFPDDSRDGQPHKFYRAMEATRLAEPVTIGR